MPAPKGNQYAIGNKGGRPPVFKSPKALAKKVDAYFIYIQGEYKEIKHRLKDPQTGKVTVEKEMVEVRPPENATITGLALYLGFVNRRSLDDYEERGDEFSGVVARARARVEYSYEQRLYFRDSQGAVFALKNMGWKDKQEIESTNRNLNVNVPLTPEKMQELEKLKNKDF
jgi:hypothetical protein